MTLLPTSTRLSDALNRVIDGRSAPSADRPFLSAGLHDIVHEHHRAICILASEGLFGSALSLLRPMFDGCIRGLWLRHIATDDEIDQFSKHRFDPNPTTVLKALQKRTHLGSDGLRRLYDEGWKTMSSYVHGGFHQVVGRLGNGFIGSNYPQEMVDALLKEANWIALLSAVEIAEISSDSALLQAVVDVGNRYVNDRNLMNPGIIRPSPHNRD